jgi:hypothetical protein
MSRSLSSLLPRNIILEHQDSIDFASTSSSLIDLIVLITTAGSRHLFTTFSSKIMNNSCVVCARTPLERHDARPSCPDKTFHQAHMWGSFLGIYPYYPGGQARTSDVVKAVISLTRFLEPIVAQVYNS